MANELSTETATRVAEDLLSLPKWLATRMATLTGQNRDLPLPRSLSLNSQQKQLVKGRAAQIRAALDEMPDNTMTLNLLGDFLLTYSPPGLTEAQAMARARAYVTALGDIPTWCLTEAINRWHRGELLNKANLSWPIPADLRAVATDVKACAEGRVIVMERMLMLEEKPEHSEEHKKTMFERVRILLGGAPRKALATEPQAEAEVG